MASWTASLRDGRANPTPWPANAKEPPTSAGSGEISPEFSESAGLRSFLEKTFRGCFETPIAVLTSQKTWAASQMNLLAAWEPFCGIWPKAGLCLAGSVYELPTWAPRTAAPESSSSAWPTTSSRDMASSGRHSVTADASHPGTTLTDAAREFWPTPQEGQAQGGVPRTTPATYNHMYRGNTMQAAVEDFWPTIRAQEDGSTPEAQKARMARLDEQSTTGGLHHKPTGLTQRAALWPTARMEDSESTGGHRGTEDTLTSRVANWPTPDATVRDGSQMRTPAPGRSTPDVAAGDRHGVSLHHATEQWRTPGGYQPGGAMPKDDRLAGGHGLHLQDQVESWSTPNAHDACGQRGPGFSSQDRHHKPHDLTTETESWPTPKAQAHDGMRGTDPKHGRVLDESTAIWRTPHTRDFHPQGPRADHPQRQLYLCDQTDQWMTPNTPNGGRKTSRETVQAKGSTPEGKRQVPLEAQAEFWPTPDAALFHSNKKANTQQWQGENTLTAFTENAWPTPRTTDDASGRINAPSRNQDQDPWSLNLSDKAENWPTPAARDWKSEESLPESHMEAHAPTLSAFIRHEWTPPEQWGTPRKGMERLQEATYDRGKGNLEEQTGAFSEMWKTPHGLQHKPEEGDPGGGGEFARQIERWTTPTQGNAFGSNHAREGGASLATDALTWPTPGAEDGGGSKENNRGGGASLPTAAKASPSSRPAHPTLAGLTFSERIRLWLRLCRLLRSSLRSPYNKARSMFRKKLNPDFVEWLMAWPSGFTSEGPGCSSWATASYLSRQRSLLRSLLGGSEFWSEQ